MAQASAIYHSPLPAATPPPFRHPDAAPRPRSGQFAGRSRQCETVHRTSCNKSCRQRRAGRHPQEFRLSPHTAMQSVRRRNPVQLKVDDLPPQGRILIRPYAIAPASPIQPGKPGRQPRGAERPLRSARPSPHKKWSGSMPACSTILPIVPALIGRLP